VLVVLITTGARLSDITQTVATGAVGVRLRQVMPCVDDDVDDVHTLGEGIAKVDVVKRHDGSLALGPLQGLFALKRLLPPHLVFVKLGKIVDDNGNGQGNDQYSANATDAPDNLAERRDRIDITVADRRHGDSGPPEGFGDAGVLGTRLVFLGKVAQTGEDEDAHGQEEHQQAQLFVRIAQRETQTLQTGRMARQFQNPQDPHDAEHLHHPPHVLELLLVVVALVVGQEQRHVVREDGQQVDHVHGSFEELPLVGRGREAQKVLEGEPRDAHRLHVGQIRVVRRVLTVARLLKARQSVQRQCYRR